ncbi:MAG TPA: protein kinase [Anaerolineales bacterium]
MNAIEVSILGRFQARVNGRVVEFPSRASQSLLAFMLINRGVAFRRELLAGMFWPDSEETIARNNLRHVLWQIRRALGDVFTADKVTVALDPAIQLDLDADAIVGASAKSVEATLQAVDRYHGDLLPGFYEEWVILERERLREAYARLMERLLEGLIEARRWSEVSTWAERWIALGHVPEPAYRSLMVAHAARGDQAGVAAIYQRCVDTLERDLGVDPSPQTRSLHQRLMEVGLAAALEVAPGRERYVLQEVIGRGGMGEVYRAVDTWLDRAVAIKMLSSETLGSEGRERLLREAQAAARLNHPNVVSVYDVGERGEQPFIVMELVEGESLHTHRPEGMGGRLAIALEICAALEHAHAQGVIHRDLKPENVMLAPDGMAQLMDFGLASRTVEAPGAPQGGTAGTVDYLAPEVLRGEPASAQSDLYALGVLLYELLTGELPFRGEDPLAVITQHLEADPRPPSELNPEIRPALEALILRLLSKRPAERPLSAAAVAEVLEAVAPEELQLGEPAPGEPPFKGLEYYDVEDADIFFGREALVERLIERLRGERFLVVIVGASGSGKSSIARAGLVPALQAANGKSIFRLLTPTEHPLAALAAALTPKEPSQIETAPSPEDLASDPRALHPAAQWLAESEGASQLVLVFDQLEELFTLCDEEAERRAVIDNLLTAADPERPGPTVVVITLRADFYPHCAAYPALREALARHQEYIGPMSTSELRRAIEEPAQRGGWKFQSGLVDLMLRDVRDQPGALPLLSHALLETWKRRSRRTLTLRGYAEAGGVRRAIARTAEHVYNQELDEPLRGIARNIFLRLTDLGEGTEDTRRRVTHAELMTGGGGDISTHAVLATLAAARLITLSEEHVEVAHEALIREWPRLRVWLDADREGLRIHRHLTEAAQAWQALDRDPGELYRGGRLAQASEWAEAQQADLNPLEHEFLGASQALARQLELEREAQIRRLRRRAVYLAGALVSAVGLAIATGSFARRAASSAELAEQSLSEVQVANSQLQAESSIRATAEIEAKQGRADAERQELVARSRELAAAAVAVLDADPELSMLLSLESFDVSPPGAVYSASGVLALRDAMQANRLVKRFSFGTGATYARITGDGSRFFTWSPDRGLVTAIDVSTGAVLWTYEEPTEVALLGSIGLSPDETLVAVVHHRGGGAEAPDTQPARIIVLRSGDGEVVTALQPGSCPIPEIERNGFSPDGRWLLVRTGTERCADDPASDWVSVYDTATWEEAYRLQIDGGILEWATFNASSDLILMSSKDGPLELRSFPDLELIRNFGEANAASLSPDGTRVVLTKPRDVAAPDPRPRVFDAATGQPLFYLDPVGDFVAGDFFMFSGDGSKVVVTTRVRTHVFATQDGRLLTDLGGVAQTLTASFTADGNQLLTTILGNALLWNLGAGTEEGGTPIELTAAPADWINPDWVATGPTLAVRVYVNDGVPGEGIVIGVLDPQSGTVTHEIQGSGAQLPDGRFVVTLLVPEGDDRRIGPLVIWDPESGEVIRLSECSALYSALAEAKPIGCDPGELFVPRWGPGVAGAPDGTFFAVGSYAPVGSQQRISIWDPESRQVLYAFDVSPDEEVVAAGDTWIAIWNYFLLTTTIRDTASGKVIAELPPAPYDYNEALSPDGSLLFASGFDGFVRAFDTSTWELVAVWQAHDVSMRGLAISPDGDRLVTTGNDDIVKVWDISKVRERASVDEPLPLLDRIPAPKPSDAAWVAADRLMVFLADGAQWLEVSLSVQDLAAAARGRVTRSFTAAECATYQISPCPTLEEIKSS